MKLEGLTCPSRLLTGSASSSNARAASSVSASTLSAEEFMASGGDMAGSDIVID